MTGRSRQPRKSGTSPPKPALNTYRRLTRGLPHPSISDLGMPPGRNILSCALWPSALSSAVRGRWGLGCSSRCLRRRGYTSYFSPKMAASDSPSCVAKKRPCPASYITRIESCSYSRLPADDEAVALRRALQQPVERVSGFLEAGLFHPDALSGRQRMLQHVLPFILASRSSSDGLRSMIMLV